MRRLILVTGAPRSGTTPVGRVLAKSPGAVDLYEPYGNTGLKGVDSRYPVVGQDLSADALQHHLAQMARFKMQLRPQARGKGLWWQHLGRRVVGSQTQRSLTLARLQPWAKTVVIKDPHMVFMAGDVAARDIDVVFTYRAPLAHAASFKRLSFVSQIEALYPAWSARFGADPVLAARQEAGIADSVTSAACLWRMAHLPLTQDMPAKVRLLRADALAADEVGTYRALLADLGLAWAPALDRHFAKRTAADGAGRPPEHKVHDFSRSVRAANSYWKDELTTAEVDTVRAITEDVEARLAAAPAA